jgi:hypothetical protein
MSLFRLFTLEIFKLFSGSFYEGNELFPGSSGKQLKSAKTPVFRFSSVKSNCFPESAGKQLETAIFSNRFSLVKSALYQPGKQLFTTLFATEDQRCVNCLPLGVCIYIYAVGGKQFTPDLNRVTKKGAMPLKLKNMGLAAQRPRRSVRRAQC